MARTLLPRRLLGWLAIAGLAAVVAWVVVFHLQVRDAVRAFVALQQSRVRSGDPPIPIEDYMRPARERAARVATAWSAGAAVTAIAAGAAAAGFSRGRPGPPGASR